MTDNLFGLNSYVKNANTEMGFTNFQWVLPGKVARASQPGYTGHDAVQNLTMVQVAFLRMKGIRCIVSANEHPVSANSLTLLNNANIHYHHYAIRDFQPATAFQLQNAAQTMQTTLNAGGAVLVFCGFGQGRTGTFVAGWAMQQYMPRQYLPKNRPVNIDAMCNSTFLGAHFGVETAAQVNAIRSAAALPAMNVATVNATPGPQLSAGSWQPPQQSFPRPFFSGSSMLGSPDWTSQPGLFANFSAGDD